LKTKRIFVYGSLMLGFYNYEKFLKGKTINQVLEASIEGKLFHLSKKGYPAIIFGRDTIYGQVLDIIDNGKTFEKINQMEGIISPDNPKNEYNIETREVKFLDGRKEYLPVYIYNSTEDKIINNDLGIYISSGDWKLYMMGKK